MAFAKVSPVGHRVFLTIRIMNKVLVSGETRGPGAAPTPPPPYSWTKLRPEGPKKIFWRAPPPFPKGVDDRPPPPLISRSGSGTVGDAELIIIYVSLSFLR